MLWYTLSNIFQLCIYIYIYIYTHNKRQRMCTAIRFLKRIFLIFFIFKLNESKMCIFLSVKQNNKNNKY